MAALRQLIFAVLILVAAAAAWVRFFPGAPEILAGWGMEWAAAAIPPHQPETGAQASGDRHDGTPQTAVITRAVARATINDKLSAIGTGRANSSVTVTPYESGRLVDIAVASGMVVKAGDEIARLDSDAEEIAVDRARVAVTDAKAKLDRAEALRARNAATAVQVSDAQLEVTNAELALRAAELALARRSILSPIDGIVGILPVEAGNYVTSSTAIVTIDDRSQIIIDFWVPERYASAIRVGEPVGATPIARPSETFEGVVSQVDNRLDEQSRTLLVRARIPNRDDTLRAGMSFQITMRFAGDSYPSVDPLAIQWGTDGSFVWSVRNGKAERVPVRIIQRNTENVLVEAALQDGDSVVTEGIHAVREGADVLVAGQPPAASTVIPQSGS